MHRRGPGCRRPRAISAPFASSTVIFPASARASVASSWRCRTQVVSHDVRLRRLLSVCAQHNTARARSQARPEKAPCPAPQHQSKCSAIFTASVSVAKRSASRASVMGEELSGSPQLKRLNPIEEALCEGLCARWPPRFVVPAALELWLLDQPIDAWLSLPQCVPRQARGRPLASATARRQSASSRVARTMRCPARPFASCEP